MVSNEEYSRRAASLQRVMEKHGIDCLLLNRAQSVKYLTGGDNTCSWVMIHRNGRQVGMIFESDYLDYKKSSTLADIRPYRPHDPVRLFREMREDLGLQENSLAAETDHLRTYQYRMIEEFFGPTLNRDACADKIVEEARAVKTPEEVELVKKAAELAMLGMRVAGEVIVPGATELGVAAKIREALMAAGAEASTFMYVAAEARSSLAHAPSTKNEIVNGPVIVDIHPNYRGYFADVARTFFLNDPDGEQRECYDYYGALVRECIGTVKPGTHLVDARKYFYHNLKLKEHWIPLAGPLLHGVGVMRTELPRFGHPFEGPGYAPALEPGMTIAWGNIGMYSKKGWGIRYEDTFAITENGPVILSAE